MADKMTDDRYPRRTRAVILGCATLACAGATASVVVFLTWWELPPSDGAYGHWLFFIDPFVWTVAIPIAVGAASVAYPFVLLTLLNTDLSRSIPFVFIATLVVAAGVATMLPDADVLLIPAGGLVGGLAAMVYSRWRWRLW
jgi:hypothetical protein